MTREEAITVLKTLMKNPLFSEVHKVAFNIAIHDIKQRHDWDINNLILINKDNYELLEQESTTKNDLAVDCISRKAAEDITWQDPSYTDPLNILTEVRDKIRDLPSVTPQEPILDKITEIIEPLTKVNQDLTKNKSENPTGSTTKDYLGVDAVSRKEVMEQCQEWRNLEFVKMTNPYYYLEKRLKALSSVTPIRPKGHWIPIYQGDEIIDYRCSECEFGNTFGKGTFGMNFCPGCGSDNREVEK